MVRGDAEATPDFNRTLAIGIGHAFDEQQRVAGGEPCAFPGDQPNGPACEGEARCVNGVCTVDDPTTCLPPPFAHSA